MTAKLIHIFYKSHNQESNVFEYLYRRAYIHIFHAYITAHRICHNYTFIKMSYWFFLNHNITQYIYINIKLLKTDKMVITRT